MGVASAAAVRALSLLVQDRHKDGRLPIKTVFALTLAVGFGFGLTAVRAAPVAAGRIAPGAGIVLVEGGCGPGGHRDRFGYCRPNYVPPPRYYRCPPYYHPTPYGCRPD